MRSTWLPAQNPALHKSAISDLRSELVEQQKIRAKRATIKAAHQRQVPMEFIMR
jgi:hypothetical protein